MFRKLKDKIAEEVKSSPQRLQQFAQAAQVLYRASDHFLNPKVRANFGLFSQAAVTSASSSISDISNNDLFSIADDGEFHIGFLKCFRVRKYAHVFQLVVCKN